MRALSTKRARTHKKVRVSSGEDFFLSPRCVSVLLRQEGNGRKEPRERERERERPCLDRGPVDVHRVEETQKNLWGALTS